MDPRVPGLLVQGDSPSTEEQLLERIGLALADEVRRMLDEGVVAEAQDIDLCMIMGAGWPFWLGGLTPYLDRSGASERAAGSRFRSRVVIRSRRTRSDLGRDPRLARGRAPRWSRRSDVRSPAQ
jgi:hypothetical protein